MYVLQAKKTARLLISTALMMRKMNLDSQQKNERSIF